MWCLLAACEIFPTTGRVRSRPMRVLVDRRSQSKETFEKMSVRSRHFRCSECGWRSVTCPNDGPSITRSKESSRQNIIRKFVVQKGTTDSETMQLIVPLALRCISIYTGCPYEKAAGLHPCRRHDEAAGNWRKRLPSLGYTKKETRVIAVNE